MEGVHGDGYAIQPQASGRTGRVLGLERATRSFGISGERGLATGMLRVSRSCPRSVGNADFPPCPRNGLAEIRAITPDNCGGSGLRLCFGWISDVDRAPVLVCGRPCRFDRYRPSYLEGVMRHPNCGSFPSRSEVPQRPGENCCANRSPPLRIKIKEQMGDD